MFQRFQGWRTMFHVAWITAVGGLLAGYDQLGAFGVDLKSVVSQFVPIQYVGLVMVGIAVLFGYMRVISTTSVFKRDDPCSPSSGSPPTS